MTGHDHVQDKIRVFIDSELRELIPGFLDNRRRDLERLSRGIAEEDFETLRVLGHRMRGDGGGYGFDLISEIGHAIEAGAAQRDGKAVGKAVEELTRYLDRLEVVYE